LHNEILHKYEFGQAHCVDLTKRSPKILVCHFLTFLQVCELTGSTLPPASHHRAAGSGRQAEAQPAFCPAERSRPPHPVMEDASSGSVHRRGGGSSGGRWRWRHDPIVSARKREGESGLKWGQRWYMGGSHREEAEAVVLRRGLERRGVSGGGSR
jgi:hypothetical protein